MLCALAYEFNLSSLFVTRGVLEYLMYDVNKVLNFLSVSVGPQPVDVNTLKIFASPLCESSHK